MSSTDDKILQMALAVATGVVLNSGEELQYCTSFLPSQNREKQVWYTIVFLFMCSTIKYGTKLAIKYVILYLKYFGDGPYA